MTLVGLNMLGNPPVKNTIFLDLYMYQRCFLHSISHDISTIPGQKKRIHEYGVIYVPFISHWHPINLFYIHTHPWISINPCISQYPDKYMLNTVRASHSTTIYRDYTPWYPHDILKNLLYPNHMHTKTNQTKLNCICTSKPEPNNMCV